MCNVLRRLYTYVEPSMGSSAERVKTRDWISCWRVFSRRLWEHYSNEVMFQSIICTKGLFPCEGIGAGIGSGRGKMKNKRDRKKIKIKYLHPWTVRPVCQDRLLGKSSKARPTSTTLKRGVDAGMGKEPRYCHDGTK